MAPNIFAQGMDAFDRSYDRTETMRQDRARMQAGRALAGGDRGGAMRELGGAGNIDGVRVLQRDQQAEEAGRAEQDAAKVQERLTLLTRVAQGLKQVPPGQRRPALDGIMPVFEKVGMDPSVFAPLTEEELSDQSLDLFTGQIAKEAEQYTLSPGSKRYDATGKLIAEAPFAPQYRTVGEGQSLVELSGEGGAGDGGGDWLSAVAQAAPDAQVTSAYRDPQKNASVGGKPNSRHMSGQAVDLVPRPGETMAQLHARVSRVPGVKAINEGDHVHVQATGARGAQGGARVVAQGAPKRTEQWVDLPGGGQRNTMTGKTEGVPKASGRLSATVVKMQNDLLQDLQSASSVNTVIDRAINQIDKGELNLGPVSNVFAQGRNIVGASDANSRNFATFKATLEKMRNDSLRLNKGVQTEGDAQRAWNELLASMNDERVVRQRLEEIRDLNEQAIALRQDLVNQARQDSGMEPLDTGRFKARRTVNDPGPGRAAAPSGAPRPGEVRKGYRFNGGDPSKPSSWTKVQ